MRIRLPVIMFLLLFNALAYGGNIELKLKLVNIGFNIDYSAKFIAGNPIILILPVFHKLVL